MPNAPVFPIRVAIRGGGDLGSGVAFRLVKCGFPVLITELEKPLLVRRAVAYGSAAVEENIEIDGISAIRVNSLDEALDAQTAGQIPVMVDPEGSSFPVYNPFVLVDARMRKKAPERSAGEAPLSIGLGPGFVAPDYCTAVIETNRGHNLGRVIWQGSAEPNTGVPGTVLGQSSSRVLRAPVDGPLTEIVRIGDRVEKGQPVARVGREDVLAPFDGVLRGLVHDGLTVKAGMKIGDVDPRANRDYCFTISEKALAIGGGVLEAVLSSPAVRDQIAHLA
nr:EF2563 family selenium-dependent molybdenum hydroxylase system protein [Anaerolineae bacterium]